MKKILISLTTVLMIFLFPITALAAKEVGKCNIIVHYSSFLTPQEDNKFEISFKDGTGAEQTFEVNAYSLAETTGSIELPVGVYTITDIKYIGESEIEDYGYSIPTYFTVSTDETKKDIEIAIGYDEIVKMNENEDSIIIRQGILLDNITELSNITEDIESPEHQGNDYLYHNGWVVGDDEGNNNQPTEEDLVELASQTEENVENVEKPETPTQVIAPNEEIAPIEKKTEVKEEPKPNNAGRKSLISRIIILGMLVVIVGISIFILKKQGKI